jgi:hypothetical protein
MSSGASVAHTPSMREDLGSIPTQQGSFGNSNLPSFEQQYYLVCKVM